MRNLPGSVASAPIENQLKPICFAADSAMDIASSCVFAWAISSMYSDMSFVSLIYIHLSFLVIIFAYSNMDDVADRFLF